MNTFGHLLRLTTFGESHGPAVGGVLDGFPSGIEIQASLLETAMQRRRPDSPLSGSGRQESDQVEILSGIYQGISTGTPLAFLIRNTDARSSDYAAIENAFRPSHADDTYQAKYGFRDPRGGGRASARETAARVAAGAFATMFLQQASPIRIHAYTSQVGTVRLPGSVEPDWEKTYQYPSRCPHEETDREIQELLSRCRQEKDSIGGVVDCRISGLPKGLGQPLYDKLTARLAQAMMGLNAARGFEIGKGFAACSMKGSQHNDRWTADGKTEENICGGVRGGISTGEDLFFRVGFKPVASIGQEQYLLQQSGNRLVRQSIGGRHDVCCVPRAVCVVEAMTALALADFLLLDRSSTLLQHRPDTLRGGNK